MGTEEESHLHIAKWKTHPTTKSRQHIPKEASHCYNTGTMSKNKRIHLHTNCIGLSKYQGEGEGMFYMFIIGLYFDCFFCFLKGYHSIIYVIRWSAHLYWGCVQCCQFSPIYISLYIVAHKISSDSQGFRNYSSQTPFTVFMHFSAINCT